MKRSRKIFLALTILGLCLFTGCDGKEFSVKGTVTNITHQKSSNGTVRWMKVHFKNERLLTLSCIYKGCTYLYKRNTYVEVVYTKSYTLNSTTLMYKSIKKIPLPSKKSQKKKAK